MKFLIRPEAEKDIETAALWYEKQQRGLGTDFLNEILNIFETITDKPTAFSVVHRRTRRAIVHRFPFGVFTELKRKRGNSSHCSRHPKRWQLRV